MQALSKEMFYPPDQYQKKPEAAAKPESELKFKEDFEPKPDAKGYMIKPLNALQFTEVMATGFESRGGVQKMNFAGIMLLLRYGLEDPQLVNSMSSNHHVMVANGIYEKSALAEAERKN